MSILGLWDDWFTFYRSSLHKTDLFEIWRRLWRKVALIKLEVLLLCLVEGGGCGNLWNPANNGPLASLSVTWAVAAVVEPFILNLPDNWYSIHKHLWELCWWEQTFEGLECSHYILSTTTGVLCLKCWHNPSALFCPRPFLVPNIKFPNWWCTGCDLAGNGTRSWTGSYSRASLLRLFHKHWRSVMHLANQQQGV